MLVNTGLPPTRRGSGDTDPSVPPTEPLHARIQVEPDPTPWRLLVLALLTGIIFDVGARGGPPNGVVAASVAVVVATLLSDRRIENPHARALAVLALVPAMFLAVRVSPWLVMSNVGAILGLLAAAVTCARSGSMFDTTPLRLLDRAGPALVRGALGARTLAALVPGIGRRTRGTIGRVTIAGVIALPMMAVLVMLLAAADPVFAGMIVIDVNAGTAFEHAILVLVVGALVVALASAARGDAAETPRRGVFGPPEVLTMLVLVAVVLGLFVVSQLVALTGAGQRLVERAGMTPADYARSGFFQLCWASALLLGFLAFVRHLATTETLTTRAVRVASAVVPLLAVGLVIVSLRRMAYYDAAFGLTMLRLWVSLAAIWMGAVLVMLAVRNAGFGPKQWVTGGAGVAAFVLLVAANVINAEGYVARHNLDRASAGHEVDVYYLAALSDDAVPAIASALDDPALSDDAHRLVAAMRCNEQVDGVARLNLAVVRAGDVRDRHCAR